MKSKEKKTGCKILSKTLGINFGEKVVLPISLQLKLTMATTKQCTRDTILTKQG
jgi:hypothetical protein